MLLFSEYQSDHIDLTLDFYGYEDCSHDQSFGPSIRNNYVLHYIVKGKGRLKLYGKEVSLQAGDLFLLPKNVNTYYHADHQDPWSYYWVGINGTKIDDFFRFSKISQTGYLLKTDYPTDQVGQALKDLIRQAEQLSPTPLSQLQHMAGLYQILYLLGELAPQEEVLHPSQTYQLYVKCKHFIDTHYNMNHLSIQGIADELSVNRSYLTSIFKDFHQISPKEYLYQVRMQRALQLLQNTDETIKVIAYSVGFMDPLYFSKAFKNFFDKTPSQVRETK